MPRLIILALTTIALAFGLAACGGSDEKASAPPEAKPAGKPADFPAAEGRTLQDLQSMVEEGPVLAPSVSVLQQGENRFGFALFDTARKQIQASAVGLYVANKDGTDLRGPFLARKESLAVEPEFQSTTTSGDADAAKAVYVADLELPADGEHLLYGIVQTDGRMVGTGAQSIVAGRGKDVPGPGEPAIKVSTETIASSGGNVDLLTTRRPPARELLKTDFADVLGKKPVVLSFATPLLCASRVCGPVIDIVEQVRARTKADVAFIQQEIYKDNEVDKGVRDQVAKWKLPSEPWTFVIDGDGKVVERFEGAFSAEELTKAVEKVT